MPKETRACVALCAAGSSDKVIERMERENGMAEGDIAAVVSLLDAIAGDLRETRSLNMSLVAAG
ncbi:MAG: hypothetical protein HQL37_07840 [Alphaproteobacteria bacterium]|nr:hypothetical protein [Alphaproteobacteria bacterium]